MIAARHASLIAFAQARGSDCGRDADGKFSSGNKCAVEVADVSKAAGSIAPVAASASVGAAIGSVAGLPGMAIGSALGAVFGAVHSYFMKSHSEMVADAQKTVGLTGKQVDSLARALGAGDKEKASGFVTTADAFGIWAPNDDIALVTDSNPFNRGEGDDSRHLHFEPTPDTMRSGAAATVAEKAASSVGAKTVTVSSRGPISAKSLEEAGFKKIDHKSQMMEWSGTSVYQKNIGDKSSKRAFCPNGKGNGVTNTCGKGIGVNDAEQDFTGQILAGEKTIETRPSNSLKPYIGKTVGIVRTGKGKATLVGVMKVGEPKFYKTRKEFDADFDKHKVGKESGHYIGPEGKFGYPLSEVKPVKPRILKSTGYVARVIAKKVKTRDLVVEFDLDAESPEEPNTEARGDAPAPEKDRIKGSDVNDEGSAKNKSGDISLDESTISSLKKKVEEHNAAMREAGKPDWTHVRLPSLKAVFRRGAGAFSTSHRPGMARDQWAMARVNAFLILARRGRPENAKYTTDNDLLHSSHPKHSKESRGFCATGEGGGIDNSCGAKTMSAPDKDGGDGSSAPSSVVFSSSTTAKLRDGDTIDASDEDADENVSTINWQAAEDIGRSNPELQQAVYKYSAGPHEVNGYFRYGESLDEYAENIGSTPEKLAASASATESAITTIAAAANPDGRELTSFRGLMNRRQNREYIEAIKSVSVGDVIKEAGVFSTSASLRRASMAFTSQDEGVIFRVKGKGGAPIAHVANYKDEWEVAYPNRSRFVVTSVARNVSVRISDSHRLTNVTFIDIREAD